MAADDHTQDQDFIRPRGGRVPVVGLGGSAGAIDALTTFFDAVPDDMGAAIVVIQHLSPDHASNMAEIIGKHTAMPVEPAADGVAVEANHAYVMPPGVFMQIEDGRLRLSEIKVARGARMPIDLFFRSLAVNLGRRAVCVVLSGAGSDGTLGLRAVKERGGLAIVQDPAEASYDAMPRSAISTNAVDLVLSVPRMPDAIANYYRQPYANGGDTGGPNGERLEDVLGPIVKLLAAQTGHDFSSYKRGTLLRRTERRMAMHHVRQPSQYLELLRTNQEEAELLTKDLLINVTMFFRDPKSFDALAEEVISDLLKDGSESPDLRLWVPACSTGEEAYSLAMLFIEQRDKVKNKRNITIFASDVDEEALAFARDGVYPRSIEADVTPERLERFFEREDHTYQIRAEVRESIVFAVQNLLVDPPFSRLDLISCRNLLIYLQPDVQEKLLELFHFALQGRGVLFLGPSETVAPQRNLFRDISRPFHIYRCSGQARQNRVQFPIVSSETARPKAPREPGLPQRRRPGLLDVARDMLVKNLAPASVVVNQRFEATHFFGRTDRYFLIPAGEASHDVLRMARDGLRTRLRMAIQRCLAQDEPVTLDSACVTADGDTTRITLRAYSFQWDSERFVLISLTERPTRTGAPHPGEDGPVGDADNVEALERELETTREELQETIRDLESANEELRAAHEEALSMNEEFQSTNEELETSKEELQSVNEELTTLNSQLQQKAELHRQAANDLNNLLVSADIATVFLDTELRIKLFTPAAKWLFNIIPSDIDRPLADLAQKFEDPRLLDDARRVLTHLEPVSREIESEDGSWFSRRVRPYRTDDNKIEGVVLTFHDISDLMQSRIEAEQKRDALRRLAAIVESSEDAIVLQDTDGMITAWNAAAERIYGYSASEAIGRKSDLIAMPGGRDEPARLLDQVLKGHTVQDHWVKRSTKNREEIWVSVTYSLVRDEAGEIVAVSTIERDITKEVEAQAALAASERRYRGQFEELEALYRTAPVGLLLMDRDLRYLRINERLAEINGRPLDEHPGRTIFDVVPDIAEKIAPLLRRILETGEVVQGMEIAGQTARDPGAERHWLGDFHPVMGPDGEIVAIGGIVREVTEEKRARDALKQAMEDAEHANRVKSDFLAAASHDIRQPLQTLSFLQEILAKRVGDPELLKVVATLGATISGMIETLNTLLEIDQLESGATQPEITEFAVGECLQRLHDEYLHPAQAKGLEFRVVPTTAVVRTDPQLFIRVLQNLLSNAIKYTNAGRVLLGCRRHGGQLRIEVWDSGIGIPADEIEAIFDKYHQIDPLGYRRHGLGLGLAVARHLASLLGHGFDVRSVAGRGAVFAVAASLVEGRRGPAGTAPAKSLTTAEKRKRSILLIEGVEPLSEPLKMLLALEEFDVSLANRVDTALARFAREPARPDVIVIDASLGDRTLDLDTLGRLRDEAGGDVPVIVLSGVADREMARRVGEAGMQWLQKPIRIDRLVALVNQQIAGDPLRPSETWPIPLPNRPPMQGVGSGAATDSTIFLVEDDREAAGYLSRTLEREGYAVSGFDSAEAFLAAFDPGLRGCLITDVMLPGINGLELQHHLAAAGATLPVIIVTGRRELRIATQAVRAGAIDVLEKPVAGELIVDAVRRALRAGDERRRADLEKADLVARHDALTRREREVMAMIVEGCANKEVAYRLGISQRTVEGHRSQIMHKMGVRNLADLVRIASMLGIDPCGPRALGA